MRVIYGLGRFVLGSFFLYNGFNHLTNVDTLAGYAAAKNSPNPRFDVQASGVLQLAAGASLALGIKPKLGALGVLGFLAAATPMFHDFWTHADPATRHSEMIHFSKNVALMGAALALLGSEGDSCKDEAEDALRSALH